MQLLIDEVNERKNNKEGEAYYPIKAQGQLYYVTGHVPVVGETIEAEVRESKYVDKFGKQRTSRWAAFKGLPLVQQQSAASNGKTPMNQFVFAQAVDFYWDKIKPWEMSDEAKASVLCTCLIATADGRVPYELPPDEDAEQGQGWQGE